MKKKKTILKLAATAAMAVASIAPGFSQTNLGAACGCPSVASRPTVLLSSLATGGNLNAVSTILTCNNTYILDEKIYVLDGKSLTINAGTVIKGRPVGAGNAAALVVARGGKVFANGTETCQIVFTAEADPMDGTYPVANRGKWGGVVLLGKAKNNLVVGNALSASGVDGVGFIEGYIAAESRNLFGMPVGSEDDNDNSGIMSYVSIRHAGEVVGANNELNGLTLGSVGKGTTLHHIEVISNADDGVEFFGGNVDLKYATVMFSDDDMFDWDLGWSGRGQFWVGVKTDQTTSPGGDNGFECDGDDDKKNPALISHPFIYNATMIGSGHLKGKGLELKELTQGEIYSSVFANFKTGVNIDKKTRLGGDAYDNWIANTLKFGCNTFVNSQVLFSTTPTSGSSVPSSSDSAKFFADGNINAASVAGLDYTLVMNTTTNAVTDQYNAVPKPLLVSTCTPPSDGFFTAAPYRGAFKADSQSWLSDWAYVQLLGATTGLVDCPTDLNGDGITNNIDFLQLLGKFNQSCN